MAEWQPIATVPKDGTTVIVFFKRQSLGVQAVFWGLPEWDDREVTPDNGLWCIDDNKHGPYALRGYSEGDATHWMPMPEPPQMERRMAEESIDPEIEALGKIWAALERFDARTQIRMLQASMRRSVDAQRKADKDFDTFQRLKAKFEPPSEEDREDNTDNGGAAK